MTFEEIIQKEKKQSFDDGVKQGAEKKARETAETLLKMGLTVEQVAMGTALTVEEIRKLNTYC